MADLFSKAQSELIHEWMRWCVRNSSEMPFEAWCNLSHDNTKVGDKYSELILAAYREMWAKNA